ncbi:MAG: DMT family transporter, partial [Betaproteobacteria bacterium]|nr:DMT family transporter [Betaproteobacteria bacterium]
MHADNRRGILAMSLAMALFIANDALVKQVSVTLPGPQLIFIRGLMATTLVLIMAQAMGHLKNWRLMLNKRLWLRGSVDAAASLTYLTAVFHLPLGNATAINLASPLFITLFAIVFFKEKVTLQRGLLILLGFGGVLLVVQPNSDGFNVYAWIAVLATLFHATRDTLTRAIGLHVPALLITLSTAVSVAIAAGSITLTQTWAPVDSTSLALLFSASLFLSIAYYLLIVAMRSGEMSLVAPFRYSGLLFALLIGYVVWDEVPNSLGWAG